MTPQASYAVRRVDLPSYGRSVTDRCFLTRWTPQLPRRLFGPNTPAQQANTFVRFRTTVRPDRTLLFAFGRMANTDMTEKLATTQSAQFSCLSASSSCHRLLSLKAL